MRTIHISQEELTCGSETVERSVTRQAELAAGDVNGRHKCTSVPSIPVPVSNSPTGCKFAKEGSAASPENQDSTLHPQTIR